MREYEDRKVQEAYEALGSVQAIRKEAEQEQRDARALDALEALKPELSVGYLAELDGFWGGALSRTVDGWPTGERAPARPVNPHTPGSHEWREHILRELAPEAASPADDERRRLAEFYDGMGGVYYGGRR